MNTQIIRRSGKIYSQKSQLLFRVIAAFILPLFLLASGCSAGETVVLSSKSVKNMSIESLSVKKNVSLLTTTGGILRIDSKTGTIEITQRIGEERLLAEVTLTGGELKEMAAPVQTAEGVLWAGNSPESPKMIIFGDSVINLQNIKNITVKLHFLPKFQKFRGSNGGLMALDDTGGLAIIPPDSLNETWHRAFNNNTWQLKGNEPLPFLFIGVCPPRQYDWERSFIPVVHYSSHIQRYPTDEQIIEYSQYAGVLEMHSWVWQNRYDPNDQMDMEPYMEGKVPLWMDKSYWQQDYKWIPDNEAELKRVISTCHAHGMKFAPYVNMLVGDLDRQMAEMKRLKDTYGIDGVYMDGLYVDKPDLAYAAAKNLRELFGEDGWLTLHNTRPAGYFFPFVNTYFDLVVTSEHDLFDQWISTEYNISNTFASLWPEIPLTMTDGREFLKKLVDISLQYNNRVIFMSGKEGQWRQWRLYFTEDETNFMKEYYLGELKKLSDRIPKP